MKLCVPIPGNRFQLTRMVLFLLWKYVRWWIRSRNLFDKLRLRCCLRNQRLRVPNCGDSGREADRKNSGQSRRVAKFEGCYDF